MLMQKKWGASRKDEWVAVCLLTFEAIIMRSLKQSSLGRIIIYNHNSIKRAGSEYSYSVNLEQ